jgi:hypothetical protein
MDTNTIITAYGTEVVSYPSNSDYKNNFFRPYDIELLLKLDEMSTPPNADYTYQSRRNFLLAMRTILVMLSSDYQYSKRAARFQTYEAGILGGHPNKWLALFRGASFVEHKIKTPLHNNIVTAIENGIKRNVLMLIPIVRVEQGVSVTGWSYLNVLSRLDFVIPLSITKKDKDVFVKFVSFYESHQNVASPKILIENMNANDFASGHAYVSSANMSVGEYLLFEHNPPPKIEVPATINFYLRGTAEEIKAHRLEIEDFFRTKNITMSWR